MAFASAVPSQACVEIIIRTSTSPWCLPVGGRYVRVLLKATTCRPAPQEHQPSVESVDSYTKTPDTLDSTGSYYLMLYIMYSIRCIVHGWLYATKRKRRWRLARISSAAGADHTHQISDAPLHHPSPRHLHLSTARCSADSAEFRLGADPTQGIESGRSTEIAAALPVRQQGEQSGRTTAGICPASTRMCPILRVRLAPRILQWQREPS